MKNPGAFHLVISTLTLAVAPAVMAEDKPKPPAADKPKSAFEKYDADHNKKLNVTEGAMLQSDYNSNPNDPMLKAVDTNHDGVISDQEVMALQKRNSPPEPKKPAPKKPAPKKPEPKKPAPKKK